MREKTEITEKDFEGLLGLLAPEREEAARRYEEIRLGLVNYFYFRGASDPETLADVTINRVAARLPNIEINDRFKFAAYFYSFAAKIVQEDLRKGALLVPFSEVEKVAPPEEETNSEDVRCMEKCLRRKPDGDRALLIRYYGYDKNERAVQRLRLAAEMKTDIENLRTHVSRLRKTLRECLKNCLAEKKA